MPHFSSIQRCRFSSASRTTVLFMAAVTVLSVSAGSVPAASPPLARRPLAAVGAKVDWQLDLHLRQTVSIKSFRLVGGYLLVLTSDGGVRAIDAATGRLAWTRWLAEPGDVLRPPVACPSAAFDTFVFTRAHDVLLIDAKRGLETGRIELEETGIGSAAASSEMIFVTAPDHRIQTYRIKDGMGMKAVRTVGSLHLDPLYLADKDLLIVADGSGLVAGITGADLTKRFAKHFPYEARGGLAVHGDTLYFATGEPTLYGLDCETGATVLEYRLRKPPAGGPVVTSTSIFQSMRFGGVQRIGVDMEWPNWYVEEAKQFLAEWPGQVVLLRHDGKIMLVRQETGEKQAVVDVGPIARGVHNVWTDAVMVVSQRGHVRCIRPKNAPPLTLIDFRPPAVANPSPEGSDTDAGSENE